MSSDELGLDVGQANELKLAFRRGGWTNADIKRLCEDNLAAQLLPVLRGHAELQEPDRPTFKLTVDHGQTLAQMIAAGNYSRTNSDITADHFPLTGEGQQEVVVELFHFNRAMTSEQVGKELDKAGFRPATLLELLALGADQPELQRKFPIVALGSRWRYPLGRLCVPDLSGWRDERELDLHWFEGGWFEFCRFAAVRK